MVLNTVEIIPEHLITTVFLHPRHHHEDDRISCRNMLVKIFEIKIHHKMKVHLSVVDTLYIYIYIRQMELLQ